MSKQIWRLNSFGIGIEWTPWVAGTIDTWIPLEEGNLKPIAENEKEESGFWVIDAISDQFVVRKMSEFTATGNIRAKSFGWLLLMALGTAASPSLLETGVYKHAFTRKNDNNHPTATIIQDNATQENQSLYNMLQEISMNFEVGNIAKFDLTMIGQTFTDTTGNTPSFLTGDEDFLVSNVHVKFATDVAGLGAASRVPVQSINLTIEKNLNQIFSTKSTTTEALDFVSQHNQDFRVSGDCEITYNDTTYSDLLVGGTYQAIEIDIVGRTLIGATKYNQLTIQLAQVALDEWDRTADNNEIVSQTFGFTAMYKLGETKMITADLTNTLSAQYA